MASNWPQCRLGRRTRARGRVSARVIQYHPWPLSSFGPHRVAVALVDAYESRDSLGTSRLKA